MIIRGGENIYRREIEAVVHHLPQIAEAAVVRRPNPTYGEEPVLFVSARPNATITPGRSFRSHRRSAREIQTASRHHDPRRPAQEPRRQDRQTRIASAAGRLARQHIDKRELIMSFTKPEFPLVDPDNFSAKPLMERMRFLAQHWTDNGFGSPSMVHAIYIAKSCSSTRWVAWLSRP